MNKLQLPLFMVCSLMVSLVAGCPMDGHDDDDDDDDGADDVSSDPTFSISGTVQRLESAAPAPGNDGIGTLYIAALEACELGAPIAGAAIVPMADFSSDDANVAYEVLDLPDRVTYHLALFLDDNDNADPMAAAPDPGDLVYATGVGDGILSCIEVTVDGADVHDVSLVLTATVPE